jgi:hypothetical protein
MMNNGGFASRKAGSGISRRVLHLPKEYRDHQGDTIVFLHPLIRNEPGAMWLKKSSYIREKSISSGGE